MLNKGLATVYEGKRFAEFGGERIEKWYRLVQERAIHRRVGMWRSHGKGWESPWQYKERYRS